MVRADKRGSVAGVGAAHPVATMAAHVQERVDLAVLPAGDQHRVLAHISGEEVAGLGYLGLMTQEEPTPGKDALQLLLVDVLLDEDAPAEQTLLGGDQTCNINSRSSPPAVH